MAWWRDTSGKVQIEPPKPGLHGPSGHQFLWINFRRSHGGMDGWIVRRRPSASVEAWPKLLFAIRNIFRKKKIWCEPHLKEIPHERWLTSESDSMWPVQPFTPIYLIAGLGFIQDENSEYFPSIPKDHLNQISEEIENNIKEKFWKIRVTIFFQSQRSYRFSK